jgi:saccharopine dehydrogenase-like NADP-dependent oxidoreductase
MNALPAVDEDVVFVHAAVEGIKSGKLAREEYVRAFPPLTIENQQWRAISWTTAASISAVVELVRDGVLPQQGFLKQEEIPLNAFLGTKNGALYLEGERKSF